MGLCGPSEKCTYYLERESERARISENAYRVLANYYRNGAFVSSFAGLLERIGLPRVQTRLPWRIPRRHLRERATGPCLRFVVDRSSDNEFTYNRRWDFGARGRWWHRGCRSSKSADSPGGICCSYYVRPGDCAGCPSRPKTEKPIALRSAGDTGSSVAIRRFSIHRSYQSLEAIWPRLGGLLPGRRPLRRLSYPEQSSVHESRYCPRNASWRCPEPAGSFRTMNEWLLQYFGKSLCEKFFFPVPPLYTAAYESIAPTGRL